MSKIRSTIRPATLTREQFKRGMVGFKPNWIDLVDPVNPSTIQEHAPLGVNLVNEHLLRCPADTPRLSRRWFDRSIPRNLQDHRRLQNCLSPLTYHTFDNRFGRFDDLCWKVTSADTRRIWKFLSALRLPVQGLLYTDGLECLESFTRIVALPQCPRRWRRKFF
ncbi:Rga2 protein [Sporisorium reilianum SRZ2]|uniref:Rga2 protein n=2 Tax=Sporisorium reilianum TaxID=72558 RepID=E6ZV66_SPORE|nr:rga2 protein [Sporisorium reilianum]CBQ71123.1 Rga2 protein [Sporisorium reilianum SRZ2]